MSQTYTTARTYHVEAAATTGDGYHGVDLLYFDVKFSTAPEPVPAQETGAQLGPSTEQWDRLTAWVDTYLQGRDLTGTLHFAPTPRNLALYLVRVASAMADSLVRCTVTNDEGEAFTVAYE